MGRDVAGEEARSRWSLCAGLRSRDFHVQYLGSPKRLLSPGLDCTLRTPSLLKPGPGNAEMTIFIYLPHSRKDLKKNQIWFLPSRSL